MKLRKLFALFASFFIIVLLFIIYAAKNLNVVLPDRRSSIAEDLQDNKFLHFEHRIKQLESDLNKHHDAVNALKVVMQNILQQPSSSTSSSRSSSSNLVQTVKNNFYHYSAASEMIYNKSCPIQLSTAPKTDVQMLEMYKSLTFDNPDGGVWKQGWKIEVDEKDWNAHNKLMVFVVPHSHNDPGWIKTLDEYYMSQTKHILNNMLQKLPLDPRRKFIWAEISYLSMWWDELNNLERNTVKRLIKNKQLEIVSGGWVMNDEANSHWISTVHQYTDGHQWLLKNLNYTPRSSWSIDPFGMSATQPLLLKKMGFESMLIHRVHYSVKKELAGKQRLEFRWRQLWDHQGKSDILTHMMPFYSYDVPHTCGPDPKVCCQFDFKRLPGHGVHCPWKVPPQAITDKNVAQRAELLLDQYRKKSKLYKTNVVLIPLGDDFRYDHPTEWDVQYNNYQKLFDYMNSHLSLNVQAQFGTLSDYFDAVKEKRKEEDFPTLSGDFFTYADRDDHYWSGYYTSRPFYKRMDRVLLSYIRAADAILTLAYLHNKSLHPYILKEDTGLVNYVDEARKALSLFQHHDGITGTAKDHVVIDYAKRMLSAIGNCQKVISKSAYMLLTKNAPINLSAMDEEEVYYNIDDVRYRYDAIEEHYVITIGPELPIKRVVLFNQLTFTRHEVVSFHVYTPFVEVRDVHEKRIKCQVSPVFENGPSLSQTKYKLSFIADVPPLGLVTYVIQALEEKDTPRETIFSSVQIYNFYGVIPTIPGFKHIEISASSNEFTLRNGRVVASFNNFGLLKALKVGKLTLPVHLDFAKYGAALRSEKSGAYLFLPDGNAVPVPIVDTVVCVVKGPILSSIRVQLPYVLHVVTLYNSPGADGLGLEIENTVDITRTSNFELVMRLSTNINSTDEFYTDINGYQILKRKRFKKLPLQAQYYPIPTMAYIEDAMTRLTLLTGGPLGFTSLRNGQMEVMLDRRLNQDDNLGMGQGVIDNLPTKHTFRIILERKTHPCQGTPANYPSGFPSLSAYVASQVLLNPMVRLLEIEDFNYKALHLPRGGGDAFGVDFSMPVLRCGISVNGTMKNLRSGLVLHRQHLDICFADAVLLKQFPISNGSVNVSGLLGGAFPKLRKSSLSFLSASREVFNSNVDLSMCPMDVQAYLLES